MILSGDFMARAQVARTNDRLAVSNTGISKLSKQRPRPSGFLGSEDERQQSWSVRRRIAALLRKAFRVVFMGRQRAVGRLSGGGAAITALLMSMGVMAMPDAAMAQYVAGTGASVAGPGGNTAVGQGATVLDNTLGATATMGSVAVGTTAKVTGNSSVAIGQNAFATTNNTATGAVAIGNSAQATFNSATAIGYNARALFVPASDVVGFSLTSGCLRPCQRLRSGRHLLGLQVKFLSSRRSSRLRYGSRPF